MSTKDLEAGSEGKMLLEINKLQGLIDADCAGSFDYQATILSGANKEWDSFKALLLALKPIILDSTAVATVRTRVKLAYAHRLESLKLSATELKTRVDNMTKDRLAIISNCHKFAAGGKKGDTVVHGAGWSKVEKLILSHKQGGIKAFKPLISEAVPAALKPAPRASTGASGNTDQVSKGLHAAKSESKAPSDPVIISRSAMLKALDNVLTSITRSDVFKPGTDSKLLAMVAELEKLVELELEAPAPKQEKAA